MGVLAVALVLGGVGVAGSITAGGLLTAEVSGSDSASGLGQTAVVLGGALLAMPLARLSSARGRRFGLTGGFLVGLIGAVLTVVAAERVSVPLLLLGLLLFGGAVATGLQARFAATDLAAEVHLSRDLSIILWTTAVGAVIGPNLTEPAAATAESLGLPPLSGMFLWSAIGFALAATLLAVGLRPDPLLLARRLAAEADHTAETGENPAAAGRGLREALRAVRASPPATFALSSLVLAHASMIGLMVMTPLHLDHGGADLSIIGLVISVHVMGMYFFAPVLGAVADRVGCRPVIVAGALAMGVAGLLAASTSGSVAIVVGVALFLLGVGWSCCMVAGSSMLTASLPVPVRPSAQGMTDLMMGLAGATAGALAGLVFGVWSYAVLGIVVAALVVPIVLPALLRTKVGPAPIG